VFFHQLSPNFSKISYRHRKIDQFSQKYHTIVQNSIQKSFCILFFSLKDSDSLTNDACF
jgi:hypothetical protein